MATSMIKLPNHKSILTRRRLLQTAIASAAATAGLMGGKVWASNMQQPYEGKLLVTLQLDGGVDVTQLCDPKVNVLGEPKINLWADRADPGQAGSILYAPVASNEQFFERFASDMLVVNGVDSQTNSHETGKLYNWTGSNAEGKPSLSALFAAAQSPAHPLAYTVFHGFSRTAGLIGYNRFDDLSNMGVLVHPNIDPWSGDPKRPESDLMRYHAMVQDGVQSLLSQPSLMGLMG